jgi:hypothetical protein
MPETFIITSPDGSVAEASVFADEDVHHAAG